VSGLWELAPGTEFAGYRIESLLGHGGMAVVYLAEHIGLERKVAIKVLAPALAEDERFRERFVRESRLAASLDHPNVIPIYEAGEADGRLFIAMRFVEGTDLKGLIREFGPMEPAVVVPILRQVAGALDAAHAKGLVHRDVKPANVLIARTPAGEIAGAHVYLSDFGLTRRTSSDSGLTGTGQFMGTLDYAAPEQFQGRPTDARTDVYALGCVLFEMLTGHAPYRAEFDAALMFAHISEPPPAVTVDRAGLPPAVDDVVATAMAKSPDDRYASAGDLASDAAGALGFEGVAYTPASQPSKASKSSKGPKPGRRSFRQRLVVAGIAVAVVVALLAFLLPSILGSSGGSAEAATPAGMAIIDAKTGAQRAFVPLSKVKSPAEVVYSDGTYWVLNLSPPQFVPVSESGRVGTPVNVPFDDMAYYAVDGGTLYATQHQGNKVAVVDLAHGRIEHTFTIKAERSGLGWPVVAGDHLWIGGESGFVYELDRGTGRLEQTVGPIPSSYTLAYGEGAVWAAGNTRVVRIDPDTAATTTTDSPGGTGYLAVGGGSAWTADETKGVVFQIAPTGTLADTIRTGDGARVVSYDQVNDALWVGNQDVGTVTAIDALTGKRRSYTFGHPLQSVAAGHGTVLVQMNPGRTYEDRIDALEGNVARLFVQPYQVQSDPATTYDSLQFEVEDATCAPLLAYPDAEGAAGTTLQPEAASRVETLEGGRVYRFTIRDGFEFSPPSNEPITAETFRFSIERALGPALGDQAFGPYAVSDIEGEQAFRDGKADHISGLVASGNTLTITLTAPSPDLLARITLPFFCPVPTDSALAPDGVGIQVGPAGRSTTPGSGPYYLADGFGGEYDILERNPNYGGSRTAAFDAIALREGVDPERAVERVRDGSFDGIVQLYDPLLAPDGPVARRYASPTGHPGDPVYRAVPIGLFTTYLAFNTSKAPFDDPTVRKAAALALDRPALAAAYGGGFPDGTAPDAGLVAPNFPGLPTPPFPVDGPDLEQARALMHGRHVQAVMPTSSGCEACDRVDDAIVQQLGVIGIEVTKVETDDAYQAIHDHPEKYDLRSGGSGPDWADVASYLPILLGTYIPKEWIPADIVRAAAALRDPANADREQAADDLLGGPVAEEVPATGVGHWVAGLLLSPRLGCQRFPPFGEGLDLAALCPAAGTQASPSA
jgi:serine/threonine protein kinase/ABC-type oligopeptide transport system substrate-binding subunit